MNKIDTQMEEKKKQSFIKNSEDSRSSKNGYMERGSEKKFIQR